MPSTSSKEELAFIDGSRMTTMRARIGTATELDRAAFRLQLRQSPPDYFAGMQAALRLVRERGIDEAEAIVREMTEPPYWPTERLRAGHDLEKYDPPGAVPVFDPPDLGSPKPK